LLLIIFCETGLVVIPFLPGDSLLFAAGAFAAIGSLKLGVLIPLLCLAAVGGDTVNYHIGRLLRHKVAKKDEIRFIKREYLERTDAFFEKHGGKTIIIARFVPIIRTFAPFVAGVGTMSYLRFLSYNAIGGISWVLVGTLGGYFFGNLPFIKNNFSLVILAIVFISVLPGVFAYLKSKFSIKDADAE
jgi:membrane-associated protein